MTAKEQTLFEFLSQLGLLLIIMWVFVAVLFLLSYRYGDLAEVSRVDDQSSG